ncbi:hypothetical protein [Sporosarcina sp. FSL K6-2383]|uniref:hypothetical protein n=1 Tax=Sporosarcina sp. FSL K6-2383 TaxID=2921556 RepID=UPI003159C9A3
MTLLMMANHSVKQWEWRGESFSAQPGQFVTSLPSLVQKCGKNISIQKIRTALKRFERYGFLTDESTHQNRRITIVNWGFYQGLGEVATDASTDSQQPANRQVTANKNDKNEKKSNTRDFLFEASSEFYQLALSLAKSVKQNCPGVKEPNLQKWSNDMRLLVDRDKRTVEQIIDLIEWSGQHVFWHTVVLSPVSLRKNWDRMIIQFQQKHASRKGQVQQDRVESMKGFELDFSKGEDMVNSFF